MTKTDSSRDPMLYVYILKMISRSKDITAKEVTSGLSDLYGINKSERQVQRVLKQLAETCDLQVNDLSKPYGYRWKPESVKRYLIVSKEKIERGDKPVKTVTIKGREYPLNHYGCDREESVFVEVLE